MVAVWYKQYKPEPIFGHRAGLIGLNPINFDYYSATEVNEECRMDEMDAKLNYKKQL
jgi:hypothetical protein